MKEWVKDLRHAADSLGEGEGALADHVDDLLEIEAPDGEDEDVDNHLEIEAPYPRPGKSNLRAKNFPLGSS